MKVKIYLNKLGHESYLADMECTVIPCKGDLIEVGADVETAEVYKVKQRLVAFDGISLFVEPYNWED